MINDYSQTGEQDFILSYFKDFKGTFLDIGAFDGIEMSNTLRLLELGWSGISVEASPSTFARLEKNYEIRDLHHCKLIQKALVPNYWTKDLIFYESYNDFNTGSRTIGLGTFSKEHLKKYHWISDIRESKVKTIKTKDFFEIYGTEFDFISIDVEELNFELVLDIPWDKFSNLKLICVEGDVENHRFINFFRHFDFDYIDKRGPNLFFTKILTNYESNLNNV